MPSKAPTWLVTGTSAGLGRALAQRILGEGHNLISVSRHDEPHHTLTTARETIDPAQKSSLYHLKLDLAAQTQQALRASVQVFLSQNLDVEVDYLVNNAGVASFNALETFSESALQQTLAVNFFSPLWLIQAFLPYMRTSWKANGHEKVIVNVSSTQGLCSDASEVAYDASKHALEGMSKTLAAEVAPFGIRVMVVNLGSLRTEFANASQRNGLNLSGTNSKSAARSGDENSNRANGDDPYESSTHPVHIRKTACASLANKPTAARGDVHKVSRVLFSAVVKRPRTAVNSALEAQRKHASESGKGRMERLLLGADGYPKIQAELERLKFEVESCASVVGLVDCDNLL